MMTRKMRPNDGPGSNGLRGGTKSFNDKTAVGPWLDSVGGPSGYRRGFTTKDFETEAQMQQLGVVRKAPPLYGAGLPASVSIKPPSVASNFQNELRGDEWTTTTQTMTSYAGKAVDREFHIPSANLSADEIEKYRETWTHDIPAARDFRYQTETRRANNKLAEFEHFHVPSVRLLPGTPKPVEIFREMMMEKYGILAFSMLRKEVGTGYISHRQLQQVVRRLEISLTYAQFCQIVAFFTAEDALSAEDFVRTVVARTDDFEPEIPRGVFIELFSSTTAEVEAADVSSKLTSVAHREVVEALRTLMPVYCNKHSGLIGLNEFMTLHQDLYGSSPRVYHQAVEVLWKDPAMSLSPVVRK